MAGRIPRAFIEELLGRADIVEVINARVPLKKAGRNFVARCPFHDEKTPSFTVSPQKQFYYCFGCGATGSAIGFLMEYDHLSFPEAVEALAGHYGMSVPREGGEPEDARDDEKRRRRDALLKLNQEAAVFFARCLRQEGGKEAVAYLRSRGVDGKTARRFGLGYAPREWRALCSRYEPAVLLEAGLAIEREGGGRYDRFRHRIMFPIRNRRGQVVGFGGRSMGETGPKYLNSPETPVFHKGREVYGLYELLEAEGRPPRILVVEGYMDVIALAQQGIRYSVATLGTAVTKEHLQLLFRYSDSLIFSFDGDKAGRKAAWKALEEAFPLLGEGRKVAFLWLPEGEDPDSMVRKEGAEAFAKRLQSAEPLSEYFFRALAEGLDLSRIEDKADLHKRVTPYLKRLPQGAFRTMMRSRLTELAGHAGVQKGNWQSGHDRQTAFLPRPSLEDRLVALLARNPGLYRRLPESLRQAGVGGQCGEFIERVFSEMEQNREQRLEDRLRGTPYHQRIRVCLAQKEFHSLQDPADEVLDIASAMEKKVYQKRLENLARKADTTGLSREEKEELRRLMQWKHA